MRRIFAAGGLRISFMVFWLLVTGVACAGLRSTGRDYGYFYNAQERTGLWKGLPDSRSASTLSLIYAKEPDRPEMIIVRRILNPHKVEPAFLELQKDPLWAEDCRRAAIDPPALPPPPFTFKGEWTLEAFDKYAVQGELKGLDPSQRKKLDAFRRNQIRGLLQIEIADDAEAKLLSQRAHNLATRPFPLTTGREFIQGAVGQRLYMDFHEIERSADYQRQLALLRRIRVLHQVDPEAGQGPLTRPYANKLRANVQAGRDLEHSLQLLSQIQKLDPWCKKYDLEMKLTPAQRKILETDPWL